MHVPDKGPLAGDLIVGNIEVRLAANDAEIVAAQELRYRIFYEEMDARADPETAASKRDVDHFDAVCDHLLVVDNSLGSGPESIVGTYRLIRRPAADARGGFYSKDEYDIGNLLALKGNLLELGRSCVDVRYRNRPTMQLLWRGIAAYVFKHDIVLMFGCASLPGTDPKEHALALSYLHHFHPAPEAIAVKALPERYVSMNLMAKEEIDPRKALGELPPLVKGYLRLGGFIGEGAVIDEQFNTVDVFIIVQTDLVTDKYFQHYSRTTRETHVSDGSGS
ncbi:GNAT family N-acetyltransferase [Lacibacterium aquatile]|uniref:L-ornithine N(alpha)-acyltransferase n=1 Tax=Lacibacterium aquatile TaxID=1168082 RepID=A0ABW5DVU4_9PROT